MYAGPFRRGNEPATLATDHPYMRDAVTLGNIKSELLNSGKSYHHTKANAAKKHYKKLTHEVKTMMKQIACVMSEDQLEDGDVELVQSFEDLMDTADAEEPPAVQPPESPIEWEQDD